MVFVYVFAEPDTAVHAPSRSEENAENGRRKRKEQYHVGVTRT
jgi:hypothetical protein